ncbi:MAG: bifunctional aspartate kinase/homoserine dehydrogenase II, partial [Colwellia sp.]
MTQSNAAEQLSSGNNQLAKHAIHVHKFGGSSLATSQCIERVVDIIRQNCQLNDLVVVSANGNTTDDLFNIYKLATENSQDLLPVIDALTVSQSTLINELLNSSSAARLIEALSEDIVQLTGWLIEAPSLHQADMLSFGELWTARLLSAVLSEQVCPSYPVDARDFLVINNDKDCAVDNQKSSQQFQQQLQKGKLAVVTGYITKNYQGETCTLG